MSKSFHVFPNIGLANACILTANDRSYFPIKGNKEGKQTTDKWAVRPLEMTSGEFAVPQRPNSFLDCAGETEADVISFMLEHGADTRNLEPSDFVREELGK